MKTLSVVSAVALAVSVSVTSFVQAAPLKVGDKAPDFTATTIDGKTLALTDAKGADAVVICFTCLKCPVAVAYEGRFVDFARKYGNKKVKFLAINVNKGENLKDMKGRAEDKGFNFPFAYDETGLSAEAYGARVTPHLFVVDKNGKVAYIGSFDDNMNPKRVKKHFVTDAVDALLAGKTPEVTHSQAFGCGIKR